MFFTIYTMWIKFYHKLYNIVCVEKKAWNVCDVSWKLFSLCGWCCTDAQAERLLVCLYSVLVGACLYLWTPVFGQVRTCVVHSTAKLSYLQRRVPSLEIGCNKPREKRTGGGRDTEGEEGAGKKWGWGFNWGRSRLCQHGRQVPHSRQRREFFSKQACLISL